MKGIRGVIFDCDGVLFESHRANLGYYNAVLAHFGEPLVSPAEREKAHLCHTAASAKVLEVLFGAERAAEALAYAASLDYRQFIPDMVPEPGLSEALEHLAGAMPLAVATNRGGSVNEVLGHFGLVRYFQAVVTSKDVARPKPHPDMLLLAASQLGLEIDELIFVGDSELDQLAAQDAGMRFVAYKGAVTGDYVVQGHQELVSLVASMAGR